jgi:hypothetical protein
MTITMESDEGMLVKRNNLFSTFIEYMIPRDNRGCGNNGVHGKRPKARCLLAE